MGDEQLAAMAARIRALGAMPEEVAEEAAPGVGAVVKASAAAGHSPNGTAWAPGKKGQRVLVNAAEAVECRAAGSLVLLELVGTSTGDAKAQAIQNSHRRILPEPGSPLPKPIVAEIKRSADAVFDRIARGAR